MKGRKPLTAVGAGMTTFLLVAAAVIELFDTEFSATIGLPVGIVAGLAVLGGLRMSFDHLSHGLCHAVSGYAAFGLSALVLLALRYVNIGRDVLSIQVVVVLSGIIAIVVYVALLLSTRTNS